jgi:enamine deaminase RidA (YjgF/YER057c/UK114 family)
MSVTLVNPPELARPVGYSHGAIARGRILALAGQVGWDAHGHFHSHELVEQFDIALSNLVTVLKAAGGQPDDLILLRIYVTNKRRYLDEAKAIGEAYRRHLGKHYPAMALLQVARLADDNALVEVEGMAVIPDGDAP